MSKQASLCKDHSFRVWTADGDGDAVGGRSLVNWYVVCRPKDLGGLGILDSERFGRGLHLGWPWLRWTAPDRPWHGSELPCDAIDMDLFRVATKIEVGYGMKISFGFDH